MYHPSTDMVMGTVCHYGCHQGHELKEGPPRSECLDSGKWSIAKEPHCESKYDLFYNFRPKVKYINCKSIHVYYLKTCLKYLHN